MKFVLISCLLVALLETPLRADVLQAIDAPPGKEKPGAGAHDRSKRSATCGTPTHMTSSQQSDCLTAHNTYRKSENGANMIQLTWSDEMAAKAQALADTCIWEHGMLTDCSDNPLGQNMFISGGSDGFPDLDMPDVVNSWNSERNNYDFTSSSCSSGKVCGHWSQVVGARSAQVGCGFAQCPSVSVSGDTWTNVLIVVCDYTPAGNMEGEEIYEKGSPCSNCDSEKSGAGYKCVNNLCVKCTPASDSSCKCGTPPGCVSGTTWNAGKCECA